MFHSQSRTVDGNPRPAHSVTPPPHPASTGSRAGEPPLSARTSTVTGDDPGSTYRMLGTSRFTNTMGLPFQVPINPSLPPNLSHSLPPDTSALRHTNFSSPSWLHFSFEVVLPWIPCPQKRPHGNQKTCPSTPQRYGNERAGHACLAAPARCDAMCPKMVLHA